MVVQAQVGELVVEALGAILLAHAIVRQTRVLNELPDTENVASAAADGEIYR